MNKKEISELKKLYHKDRGCITRICGCYVGNEREIITKFKEAFYSLPEEDTFKYYDIFKKTLSGSLGKNLINMEFPLEQEKEGGTQEFLLRLRDSALTDDTLLNEFYEKIIQNYHYVGNYLILLIHNAYDVPGKASDGTVLEDASDEVYSYLLCSICPVNLSKPGLTYYPDNNIFQNCVRNWLADLPESGFLFPAFNDRSTDVHGVLYYSKNADKIHEELIESVLGVEPPLPAKSQKEIFETLVDEVMCESKNFETVKNIQENIIQKIEENEASPLVLDKDTMGKVFAECGLAADKLAQFENKYDEVADSDTVFQADNILNRKKFEIKTPSVKVQVAPESTHLVEIKMIDGRNSLVIRIEGDMEVNGHLIRGSEIAAKPDEE